MQPLLVPTTHHPQSACESHPLRCCSGGSMLARRREESSTAVAASWLQSLAASVYERFQQMQTVVRSWGRQAPIPIQLKHVVLERVFQELFLQELCGKFAHQTPVAINGRVCRRTNCIHSALDICKCINLTTLIHEGDWRRRCCGACDGERIKCHIHGRVKQSTEIERLGNRW